MKRVYCHISNIDNNIFYVGAGSYYRPTRKAQRTEVWMDVAQHGYSVRILKDNINESEALELEQLVIETIGIDNLTNIGSGHLLGAPAWNKGLSWSKETKEKISKNSGKSKKVIDLKTNTIYNSAVIMCKSLGLSYSSVSKTISGNQVVKKYKNRFKHL